MSHKLILQIAAYCMLIIGLSFVLAHWIIAAPQTSPAEQMSHRPEAISRVEDEYATGTKFEGLGDFDYAMEFYQRLKKAFPNHPTIDYSIGLCRQKQGKTAEAVEAFRRIAAAPDGRKEIVEDAKARIQKLSSPELTLAQQTYLDMADDYLRTGEDLKNGSKDQPPPTPPSNAHVLPLEHAVRYLEALKQAKPDFLPLYFRLGIANELLGRHLDAYEAYQLYLAGYEQYMIPFGDQQHEIRRRTLVAEMTLGLGTNQLFVKSYHAGKYMSHKTVNNKEAAVLSPATSPEDQAAARLKASPGIADHTGISLESSIKPGHYLRPNAPGAEDLTFGPANDETSKKESTFKIVAGLGSQESGWLSFESRSRPNWFMVAGPDGTLFLRAKTDTDTYCQSATFRILGPSDPVLLGNAETGDNKGGSSPLTRIDQKAKVPGPTKDPLFNFR